ncbi:MAG: hypothetical protein IT548_12520 [Alphaproteobacteria bacterium]|nr:hypothetical protein [Alphaproteobacteria bacterium]
MAVGTFFRRLFGGTKEAAPPPAPTRDTTEDALAESRRNAGLYDRKADPLDWANAQQILANNICSVAAGQPPVRAIGLYEEAIGILGNAIAAAGPGAVATFRASMTRLRGECAWRCAQHLTGDRRGRLLADGANWLGDAITLSPPAANRQIWVDAQLFRGACLQDLARLKGDGEQSLAWLDEAAACFDEIADRGTEDGEPHPIGAFNAYVVREQRARATQGIEARPHLLEARRRLLQAMEAPTFASNAAYNQQQLAEIDTALRALEHG